MQGVCLQWRQVGATPTLWRAACLEAFYDSDAEANSALVRQRYQGSWKTMLLDRPHLRFGRCDSHGAGMGHASDHPY